MACSVGFTRELRFEPCTLHPHNFSLQEPATNSLEHPSEPRQLEICPRWRCTRHRCVISTPRL
ncbi:hypothetical protein C0J52_04909 [Blattella germanica]|nr:hypothetical protein C0J52_04909 [Blattella germanica]